MKKRRLSRVGSLALLVAFMACTLLVGAAFSAATPNIVGDWQGALSTEHATLQVVLHISRTSDGQLTGTMDSPDQGATGIALSAITVQDADFHFEIPRLGSSYDGKSNTEISEIKGEWKQGGNTFPLTFKRTAQ